MTHHGSRSSTTLGTKPRASGPPVAVTGASGWLGRVALETLVERGLPVAAFASAAKPVVLRSGRTIQAMPLERLAAELVPGALLLHFACLTRERVESLGVEEYVRANRAISSTVLEAVRTCPPAGIFLASSGAAYQSGTLQENPYAVLKREDEAAFSEAARVADAAFLAARIFNVSGPYMTKPRSYALGDFVMRALEGRPIEIRARGPVRRSYVAAQDLVTVAVAELNDPQNPATTIDTAGDEVVEVGDLAERVCELIATGRVPIVRDMDQSVPADSYVGDGAALHSLAAHHGIDLQPLDDQIRATASWLAAAGAGA